MTDKERELEQLAIERGTRIESLERELEEERELRQQYAEDAKRNLRDRDAAEARVELLAGDVVRERDSRMAAEARLTERERELADERSKLQSAEASIAGLHDMREKLERELAEARAREGEMFEQTTARMVETNDLRRELADARTCLAVTTNSRETNVRKLKAAEARLAAVARWAHQYITPGSHLERTYRAALSAPAEPHPGVGGGDDEGRVDADIARDCLPSAAVESLPEAWENRAKCTPYPMVRRAIESCAADLKAALSAPAEPEVEQ